VSMNNFICHVLTIQSNKNEFLCVNIIFKMNWEGWERPISSANILLCCSRNFIFLIAYLSTNWFVSIEAYCIPCGCKHPRGAIGYKIVGLLVYFWFLVNWVGGGGFNEFLF